MVLIDNLHTDIVLNLIQINACIAVIMKVLMILLPFRRRNIK